MPNFEIIPGNPRLVLQKQIEECASEHGYEASILESTDTLIRVSILTTDSVGTGNNEHSHILSILRENIPYVDEENSYVFRHSNGAFSIHVDCTGLTEPESPRSLDEYREERIEVLKDFISKEVEKSIQQHTSGEYDATFGKIDISTFELYVIHTSSSALFQNAPTHILNQIAIDITKALYSRDDFPYTVDLSEIDSDTPHIRIVKL